MSTKIKPMNAEKFEIIESFTVEQHRMPSVIIRLRTLDESKELSRLIAAAPDMYEALKELLKDLDMLWEGKNHFNVGIEKAKAALSKANPQPISDKIK